MIEKLSLMIRENLKNIFIFILEYSFAIPSMNQYNNGLDIQGITKYQQLITAPNNLFSVLSKSDNLYMFCAAKDGLKMNLSGLQQVIRSRKRYYKALKELRDAGVIEKSAKYRHTYFHTTFGSIIYQRNIVEITEYYTKHLQKLNMIDTLKNAGKYSDEDIQKFIGDIIGINISSNNNNNTPSSSYYTFEIWSYEKLVSIMTQKVRNCKTELLIAAILSPEEVINEIIHKSKIGVNVKVLADRRLVQGYFKSQNNQCNSNSDKTDEKKEIERIKVIGNPWYPNNEGIFRRIFDIPFGMMIIDGKEVGIELVNRNDPKNFFAGILIKDEELAIKMKEFYYKMWDSASDDDNSY